MSMGPSGAGRRSRGMGTRMEKHAGAERTRLCSVELVTQSGDVA